MSAGLVLAPCIEESGHICPHEYFLTVRRVRARARWPAELF